MKGLISHHMSFQKQNFVLSPTKKWVQMGKIRGNLSDNLIMAPLQPLNDNVRFPSIRVQTIDTKEDAMP